MTALGTILPTKKSNELSDRFYTDTMNKRHAAVVRMGLEKLPHDNNARNPEYTRYMLSDGTWLECGRDCRVRHFETRAGVEFCIGVVTDIKSLRL